MASPNTHYSADEIAQLLQGVDAIYFLGIGGISMSALAVMTAQQGRLVGGYDRTETALTRSLTTRGITVNTQSSPANLDGFGAVVYTVAIPEEQIEYVEAKRRGLPLISRANYMGYLMLSYVNRIGVAGTHGKSTTTGMISDIFVTADADPTVLCGAVLPHEGSPHRPGGSETVVFEACEYMDSFLDFYPNTAVILNTELDHVDYFSDIARMRQSFARFADRVGEPGLVIFNADDPDTVLAVEHSRGRHVGFGLSESAEYRARDIRIEENGQSFCLICRGENVGRITLQVPGRHNVSNALAAAAVAREAGICMDAIIAGLASFGGVHRRMEYKGRLCGALLYDDYAHHPTEIAASISAAREHCRGRLVCVFQSHTYTRTAALFDDFVSALSLADVVIIAPIYAAREQNLTGVSEAALAQALCRRGCDARSGESFSEVAKLLRLSLSPDDTALVMGAGDIEKLYPLLAADIQK